jgi:hypothetical protein
MIESFGWTVAMLAFAAIAGLDDAARADHPQATKAAAAPGSHGLRDAIQDALAHRGFVFMTLAFFACGFQLVFITA